LRTPFPAVKETTHPDGISLVRNVGTPMESQSFLSKRTARNTELSSGRKMPQKAKAASRKTTGRHNWKD
jgi:hypothetical protein